MEIKDIEDIIEKDIRPSLLEHGGDIEIKSFKDGVLRLSLLGQCSNCPSQEITFKNLVEDKIKHKTNIKEVVLVKDMDESILNLARKILNGDMS